MGCFSVTCAASNIEIRNGDPILMLVWNRILDSNYDKYQTFLSEYHNLEHAIKISKEGHENKEYENYFQKELEFRLNKQRLDFTLSYGEYNDYGFLDEGYQNLIGTLTDKLYEEDTSKFYNCVDAFKIDVFEWITKVKIDDFLKMNRFDKLKTLTMLYSYLFCIRKSTFNNYCLLGNQHDNLQDLTIQIQYHKKMVKFLVEKAKRYGD